jgi:hypothetical protein
VLSEELLGLLYRGGPNLPYLSCPIPIPPTGSVVPGTAFLPSLLPFLLSLF